MKVYHDSESDRIYLGRCEDVLPTIAPGSVDLVFTSPPYNLGDTTAAGD